MTFRAYTPEARVAIESVLAEAIPILPYPGLRSFRMDEWPIFFGREIVTETVLERLRQMPFVMVHGSSGCGKSSLIFAGVLPRLITAANHRSARIGVAHMRPGIDPIAALADQLAANLGASTAAELYRILNKGHDAAPEIAERITSAGFDSFYLYIDQFEELVRAPNREGIREAARFVDVLVGLAGLPQQARPWWHRQPGSRLNRIRSPKGSPLKLLASIRSEFIGDCVTFPGLAELVNATQYLVPPMRAFDLERAIRDPAELFDGRVERALAAQLIKDAEAEADPLPLVQHALMMMWERPGQILDLAAYRKLSEYQPQLPILTTTSVLQPALGRILANHADQVVSRHGRDGHVAEMMMRALVAIDPQRRTTRHPQQLDKLIDLIGHEREQLLRDLVDDMRADGASFLRPFQSEARSPLALDTLLDISHEALFRAWPRVADEAIDPETDQPIGWLLRERDDALKWQALAVQAKEFERNSAEVLEEAATIRNAEWFQNIGGNAVWAERHLLVRGKGVLPQDQPEWQSVRRLIRASEARVIRQRRKQRRQRILLAAILLSALIMAVVSAISQSRNAAYEAQILAMRERGRAVILDRELTQAQSELMRLANKSYYIWLGSNRKPNILSARTGDNVLPSSLKKGDRVRVTSDLIVRSDLPNENYNLPRGRGFLQKGATVRLASNPVSFRRQSDLQYWSRIEGNPIIFGSVYLYYTGIDYAGATRETSVHARAQNLADRLTELGFRVAFMKQDSQASDLAEVHVFRASDSSQAQILSSVIDYTTRRSNLGSVRRPMRVKDLSPEDGTQAPQRLEIWLDLDRGPIAPAGNAGGSPKLLGLSEGSSASPSLSAVSELEASDARHSHDRQTSIFVRFILGYCRA